MSFKERMAGYAAYHKNPKNKFTHLFGVPMVFYSPLIALGWVRFTIAGYDLSLGIIVLGLILIWYFTLYAPLAFLMTLLSIPAFYYFDSLAKLPFTESLLWFLGYTIIGWAIQLIGHYFEGRKPALADNLIQSLMGPLFVVLEVLFFFGINKELEEEVHTKANSYVFPK
jgi:uncharacterized membrane protein YGL010W